MNRTRKTARLALLLTIIAMLLMACNPKTPEPPKNNKPSTEGTAKPESEKQEEEKKEIIVPDWLRDKTYLMNDTPIHFNDEGYPNTQTDADMLIVEADENKVVIVFTDENGKTTNIITRDDNTPDKIRITIEETGNSIDLTLQ